MSLSESAVDTTVGSTTHTWNERDAILYALGIGARPPAVPHHAGLGQRAVRGHRRIDRMTIVDQRRARGLRNRRALISAAIDLFTKRGYEETTVEQISAAANVAPRTFFHHFTSKDDILFDGYADRLDHAIRRFRASRSATLWGALAESSAAVAEAISEQPDVFLVRAHLYARLPSLRATMLRINDDWIDQMTREVARGLDTDACTDMRPRLAATIVNGANRAAIDTWVQCDGDDDLGAMVSESVALLRPSITRIERAIKQSRSHRVS